MSSIEEVLPEARNAVAEILEDGIHLTSVVLDEWRGAYRLVYGGLRAPGCAPDCEHCHLYIRVGGDDSEQIRRETADGIVRFHKTLAKPRPTDYELIPDIPRCVNCMSIGQYLEFYISWLVRNEHLEDRISKELGLISRFRILYLEGMQDLSGLEIVLRRFIVDSCLSRMTTIDMRRDIVLRHALNLGIVTGRKSNGPLGPRRPIM